MIAAGHQEMLHYYEQRQAEYESIYAKPERRKDLAWLEAELSGLVSGRRVLELACGTGYWTRRIAESALSVHATDATPQLADSALASCRTDNVTVGTLDAYAIPQGSGHDCVVAGFFYSHVPVKERERFVAGIAAAMKPGSRLVLFDNRYVEGSSTRISRRTPSGDTFQVRYLSDGSSHEVLKNFPDAAELHAVLDRYCGDVTIQESRYFWLACSLCP